MDCQWIAQLLQHDLLRGGFIQPQPIRELRDLTRPRRKLVEQPAAAINRIQKVLEDANIKLASVATDVTGKSACPETGWRSQQSSTALAPPTRCPGTTRDSASTGRYGPYASRARGT